MRARVVLVHIDLVYSIYDSTEDAIKKMIEASQTVIAMNNNHREELVTGSNGPGCIVLVLGSKRRLSLTT
jgi:hypothetical protein